jgi:hypothetical protein
MVAVDCREERSWSLSEVAQIGGGRSGPLAWFAPA